MFREAEDGAIQSDAYIDALLTGHARQPIPLTSISAPSPGVRHVIRVLERGLPRYHPSFIFEERLAAQLRAVAGTEPAPTAVVDRRLLVGGALASGVSIGAAAAMWAWRRRPHVESGREA
jgi:hypothetical protein